MITSIVIIGVLIVLAFWLIAIYNGLINARNLLKNAFSQIDVQLKRRYDLIPNLVETAKGYLKHERETLTAVTAARGAAVQAEARAAASPTDPEAMKQMGAAEAALTGVLGRLLAVVEAYPDLKANQNMMQLTEELTATENKISFARQAYNDAVMDYNVRVESFPNNLVSGVFSFNRAAQLESTESAEERKPVKVSFA